MAPTTPTQVLGGHAPTQYAALSLSDKNEVDTNIIPKLDAILKHSACKPRKSKLEEGVYDYTHHFVNARFEIVIDTKLKGKPIIYLLNRFPMVTNVINYSERHL